MCIYFICNIDKFQLRPSNPSNPPIPSNPSNPSKISLKKLNFTDKKYIFFYKFALS